MLFGCIHVPDFEIQSVLRAQKISSVGAVALLDGPESLLKIFACNEPARRVGIEIGMTKQQAEVIADARLLKRSLEHEDAAQNALLDCGYHFSPRVESSGRGTVVIDLTGTERILGDAESIAKQLKLLGEDRGVKVNIGIAGNPDAALCAARGFAGITVIAPGEEEARLSTLAIDVLVPSPEIADTLDAWGIRDFRSLAKLPPIPLIERLGQEGLRVQQLARGAVQRDLVPADPTYIYEDAIELEEAIELLEPLSFVINRLLEQIMARLVARSLATDHVQMDLVLEIHPDRELKAESQMCCPAAIHQRTIRLPVPTQSTKTLLKLLQLDLAAHPPQAPVKKITIQLSPAPIRSAQTGLFQPLAPEPAKLEITMARLRSVVGEKDATGNPRVGFPVTVDSHKPDCFQVLPSSSESEKETTLSSSRLLPALALRLFRPALPAAVTVQDGRPTLVRFNGNKAEVIRLWGPWRSSGMWWNRAAEWKRDEWDVQLSINANISTYRIFRDLLIGQWSVDGMYD
jgi:protein ImuB